MAKVRMTVSSYIPGVYAIESDCEYVYCDRCGSFSVETRGGAQSRTKRALSSASILMIVGSIAWTGVGLAFGLALPVGCLTGVAGAMVGIYGMPSSYLKCRKCGYEAITETNPLNYGEDDQSRVDVPVDQSIRKCFETRVY